MSDDALDVEADMDAGAGEFFDDDGFVRKCAAAAAVLFRHIGQQQSRLSRFEPGFGIGVSLFGPTELVRRQLFFDELAHRFAENPRFIGHPG